MVLNMHRLYRYWYLLVLGFVIALTGCGNIAVMASPTVTQPQTITLPQYHLQVHIIAGWSIQQQHDDATTFTPYSLDIERAQVKTGSSNSHFSLQVIKLTAPGIQQSITALATDPAFGPTTIGGVAGYSKSQVNYTIPPTLSAGQTTIPSITPHPNDPNTVIHSEYQIPTSNFLYEIYTESVAGDNADSDIGIGRAHV